MNAATAYRQATRAYWNAGITATNADQPGRRVELVLSATLAALAAAQQAMKSGDIPERARQINRAMDLIALLETALDRKAAPELSERLGQIYDYCRRRLLDGSLRKAEAVEEVSRLIVTLKSGWDAINLSLHTGER